MRRDQTRTGIFSDFDERPNFRNVGKRLANKFDTSPGEVPV